MCVIFQILTKITRLWHYFLLLENLGIKFHGFIKKNNFYYFEDIDKCEKIDKFDKLESFIVDDSMTSNISTTICNYNGEIVIISYIDCNIFPTKIRI